MNNTTEIFKNKNYTFNVNWVKGIIATMLLLFFCGQTWAIEPHTPGSHMYVVAQSGLHLRTSPDVHSNSIKIITLGEQVTILEQSDSLQTQTMDWVKGHWVLVDHMGDKGYIFDGFLSGLRVPTYDWEKCQLDLDMIYPLEQWAEVNHITQKVDTSQGTFISRVTDHYDNGDKLVKINSGNIYKIELYLSDVRIMDAYHLLLNMVDDKARIRTFHNQSIFIEANETSDLERIKIKLDNPVDIRLLDDGQVKISIHSQEYPCQL